MKVPELPKIVVNDQAKIITLVCYLLEYVGALTETQLLEIVTVDDIVSQFKLGDALSVIENKEMAVRDDGTYKITESGKKWLIEFENSLTITLRRKILREGKNVVRLSTLKREVKWSISENNGIWIFYVCFLNEMNGTPIMEIKIHSKTQKGAVKAQEKFLKDPAKALNDTISNFI